MTFESASLMTCRGHMTRVPSRVWSCNGQLNTCTAAKKKLPGRTYKSIEEEKWEEAIGKRRRAQDFILKFRGHCLDILT